MREKVNLHHFDVVDLGETSDKDINIDERGSV